MMKKLCRIRLINWHYFVDEIITVNGSFLISGENTAGKSTILDAIQLVLTTNTRKFNTAANEKSNRDLKGYVRCKTGNEDNTYIRKGSIITYVALEFFEEKTSKYFTLGVKIDSPDEESKLTTKWFCEECKLEDLSFITDNRPSTTEEFRKKDRKVQLITQIGEAKARFGHRMGNLESRFFDMIPKSLAFKPMDNVKDFINKFILPERIIEVATLRDNIEALKELEKLMDETKNKIEQLKSINSKYDDILTKDKEIKINEILIKKAELENSKDSIMSLMKSIETLEQRIKNEEDNKKNIVKLLNIEMDRFIDLKTSLANNETTQLIEKIKRNIDLLNKDVDKYKEQTDKYNNMLGIFGDTLSLLGKNSYNIIQKEEFNKLSDINVKTDNKLEILSIFSQEFTRIYNDIYLLNVKANQLLEEYKQKEVNLEKEISNLKNKKLTYPDNTTKLQNAIQKEFLNLGINSDVRIFSDLLEITDTRWQNAVEGYLNTQRFYILVEPQYYQKALKVYDRLKREIHSVGLINTGKLELDVDANVDSLAYVIKSENRYAKAYALYLLSRVNRAETVDDLKNYSIAITPECMLYQNYAVRKIDEKVYRVPFIGAHAIEIQLKNAQNDLIKLKEDIKDTTEKRDLYKKLVDRMALCKLDTLSEFANSMVLLNNAVNDVNNERSELNKAESNPNYIEIQIQINECEKAVNEKERKKDDLTNIIADLKSNLNNSYRNLNQYKYSLQTLQQNFDLMCDENAEITSLGIAKYNEQVKTKAPMVIVNNYTPQNVGLNNKKNEFINELCLLQQSYCHNYTCDFGNGEKYMDDYQNELYKLEKSEIIKYEEDLKKAKENCELEFRESFLAKLKENIETARQEFKQLNSALKGLYYGDDSYKFDITPNKKKESIYKMITSKNNVEGFNLFTADFVDEYKEEMDDLFLKLTAYDDKGERVLAEYTDYRCYLDYDIIIEKKDGSIERFSKIYGEKSGGETQTPYYVAIAASFVQLYKLGDTIRIIMLDEAFDKMDDNRISSMMDFFNSQNFQIILATPPAKMEVIGEKVDTILMAIREGNCSIVEEYDFL